MKLTCPRILFLLGYIVCLNVIANINNCFVDAETFERFSDVYIEEQLKVLNKPATKIIKTIHGVTYGCVDFFKQSAFDHLPMKYHSDYYEMYRISSLQNSKAENSFGYLWENGVGCPIGTVPIKRVTKDELLRIISLSEKYRPQSSWNFTYNQSNFEKNVHHFAVSRTKKEQGKTYTGASMVLSNHNPKVKLSQLSSARMHVQIGDDDFIQIGWIVYPNLYSDSKTRTFVYTKIGDYQCYDSMCQAGMIHTHAYIPLGMVLNHTSVRGGSEIYINTFSLLKDTTTRGNWWFEFGGQKVGFWLGNKFKQNYAKFVEWGGEVYSASLPSPEMGNGYFPIKHERYDAIIFNITTLNEKFEVDDQVKNTQPFSDNTRGYKVIDDTNSQFEVKHMIHFGGPGNI